MTGHKLAILGYHKIGAPSVAGWDTWFYIPEATFVDHLTYLGENGWVVIDVPTLLSGLVSPESLPRRSVLLTFDDGYRSMRKVVLPALLRFGYPAVLFVPTDFIGGYNRFDSGSEPDEAICDWEDLCELQRRGISIESHGVSHTWFSGLHPDEVEQELVRSKAVLEAGTGTPVQVFSYPYGDAGADPDATERALQRAGYRAACLYGGGPNYLPVEDHYRLTRVAMGPDTDLRAVLEDDDAKS